MHAFVRNLVTEWRQLGLPFKGKTVIVAVSGGADSVSLLLAMHELRETKKLDLRIVAAHFNHRLRGAESDADEEYVRHLTGERGIELAVGHGDIHAAGNLEQNARDARYSFLTNTGNNLHAYAVLTGHTINDQAETFLMNLIRGSGVDGLSGMKVIRALDGENVEAATAARSSLLLVRPLVNWARRTDTEQYCHDLGVECRYDSMNEDTAFKRVRIRKVLLPLLEDMNPNIVETLANTAELMQHLADPHGRTEHGEVPETLELKTLRQLPKPDLFRTIRSWLKSHRGTSRRLELKHIQAIERLIYSEKSGKTAEMPGGTRVVRSGGKLAFDKNKVEN